MRGRYSLSAFATLAALVGLAPIIQIVPDRRKRIKRTECEASGRFGDGRTEGNRAEETRQAASVETEEVTEQCWSAFDFGVICDNRRNDRPFD